MFELRPDWRSGRCPVCRNYPPDPSTHFHTAGQVLLWLWDSGPLWKAILIVVALWTVTGLALLISQVRIHW